MWETREPLIHTDEHEQSSLHYLKSNNFLLLKKSVLLILSFISLFYVCFITWKTNTRPVYFDEVHPLQFDYDSRFVSTTLTDWGTLIKEADEYINGNHFELLENFVEQKNGDTFKMLLDTFPHIEETVLATYMPDCLTRWKKVHYVIGYLNFLRNVSELSIRKVFEEILTISIVERFKYWVKMSQYVYTHNINSIYNDGGLGQYQFQMEMNYFSDIHPSILQTNLGYFETKKYKYNISNGSLFDNVKEFFTYTPPEMDWRDTGCIQNVKNQLHCGSCWAFSTTAAIESNVCVAKSGRDLLLGPVSPSDDDDKSKRYKTSRNLPNLSEQELVDCADTTGNHGCHGGMMEMGFEYVFETDEQSLCTEEEYPYEGMDNICRRSECKSLDTNNWKIIGWQNVKKSSEKALKNAIYKHGAISVSIEADKPIFHLYKRGIIHDTEDSKCGLLLNHGVSLVGYGEENNTGYWIVQNSWGNQWGEDGFVRLSMHEGASGQCGILLDSSFPKVEIQNN